MCASECSNSHTINIWCLWIKLRKFGRKVYLKQISFERTAWFLRGRRKWIIQPSNRFNSQSIHVWVWTDSLVNRFILLKSIHTNFYPIDSLSIWIDSLEAELKFNFISDYACLLVQLRVDYCLMMRSVQNKYFGAMWRKYV